MKTFIPEYVECVSPEYWSKTIKQNNGNLIFKSDFKSTCEVQIIDMLRKQDYYSFKPSTKEAYEAQFKEEPEFVLPEIWWVRITKENLEDVFKFLGFEPYEKAIGYITGMVKHYRTGKIEKGWNATPTTVYGSTFGDEITTEQFRKYVLKKQDENISKFINDTTVINKEGEVFKVGDVIKFANNTLKAKIINFRWKNDKSEICAVLPNIPNGVGIDKIELYIEPKVEPKKELSLLEQAKLKYPIGTKFIACNTKTLCIITTNNIEITDIGSINEFSNDGKLLETNNIFHCLRTSDGQWAEIVEHLEKLVQQKLNK